MNILIIKARSASEHAGDTPGESVCRTRVKMEFIKEEIEDTTDPEPSRIKHEDTEEQTGWCLNNE